MGKSKKGQAQGKSKPAAQTAVVEMPQKEPDPPAVPAEAELSIGEKKLLKHQEKLRREEEERIAAAAAKVAAAAIEQKQAAKKNKQTAKPPVKLQRNFEETPRRDSSLSKVQRQEEKSYSPNRSLGHSAPREEHRRDTSLPKGQRQEDKSYTPKKSFGLPQPPDNWDVADHNDFKGPESSNVEDDNDGWGAEDSVPSRSFNNSSDYNATGSYSDRNDKPSLPDHRSRQRNVYHPDAGNFRKGSNSNYGNGQYKDDFKHGPSKRYNEPYGFGRQDNKLSNFNDGRGSYGHNNKFKWNERQDKEYQDFFQMIKQRQEINNGKVTETRGDLFTAPEDFSLAHCVAEDMSMGAGIAVTFRSRFGEVAYLLNQRQKTGGLAVLEKEGRFIYYLVTKEQSRGKPTNYTLWMSLQKLREHCIGNNVHKLAIPQIGCGLDRLDWSTVKQMLEYIFRNVDIQVVVYIWVDEPDETPRKQLRKCYVQHTEKLLVNIESGTGLIYFGTEDGAMSEEFNSLSDKYNIAPTYRNVKKIVGEVIRSEDKNECIYGLITRKTINDSVDFNGLEKCLKSLRNILRKDKFAYVGFQAFEDKNDEFIVDKIINFMQYILVDVEIWVCWPDQLAHLCPPQSKSY